ncbi:hypothetical protein GCM10009122_24310 [Fulvivirga kasyanovii]|uniref:TonB C-terminal domain-containing protein n=1 Tax=Fulvivirga kasyanovii TaxID=396812 RepID=A0ABW9RIU1_9BACT|nr:energy transducer TonB [Fulvivirga kasyanovii]MTI23964.1 hypothetical protein [Fulvivirga kasyanovii]
MRKIILILHVVYSSTFLYAQQDSSIIDDEYIGPLNVPYYNGKDYSVGLKEYIHANFFYPGYAVDNEISGKVFVTFTVDPYTRSHQLLDVYIERGVHISIDYAAKLLIQKMPDQWTPAKSRGKPDPPITFTVPVVFDLENVDPTQITHEYDREIERLLATDSLKLDSLHYRKNYNPIPSLKK